ERQTGWPAFGAAGQQVLASLAALARALLHDGAPDAQPLRPRAFGSSAGQLLAPFVGSPRWQPAARRKSSRQRPLVHHWRYATTTHVLARAFSPSVLAPRAARVVVAAAAGVLLLLLTLTPTPTPAVMRPFRRG